jgi:hypothetical protein
MAATVGLSLAAGLRVLAEPAVATFEVAPSALDVLLATVQGAGAQVHGDGERRVAAQRREEDHAQKVAIGIEVVVRGMPGKPACLADFLERQYGSRSVTLLDRPRGSTSLQGRGDRRKSV